MAMLPSPMEKDGFHIQDTSDLMIYSDFLEDHDRIEEAAKARRVAWSLDTMERIANGLFDDCLERLQSVIGERLNRLRQAKDIERDGRRIEYLRSTLSPGVNVTCDTVRESIGLRWRDELEIKVESVDGDQITVRATWSRRGKRQTQQFVVNIHELGQARRYPW